MCLRTLALGAALFLPAVCAHAGIAFDMLEADFGTALFATTPSDDASRLFVVEQSGTVHIVVNGEKQTPPFIDLFDITDYDQQERGLLGMAFDPDYAVNGHFYLNYTRTQDAQIQTVVARFTANGPPATATSASIASQQIKMVIDQPYDNHNGGMMAFGPDGYLYIATGDGGSAFDPENRSQDLESYMGKLLRVDVSGDGPATAAPGNPFIDAPGLDEIWAYGLRNPWRFSFDRDTGDLWLADVGQQTTEEVNFVPAGTPGGINFGWRPFEGNGCNIPAECAPIAESVTFPIYTYGHQGGEARAITGGYRYRGSGVPIMSGAYLFADYTQGTIGLLYYTPGAAPGVEVKDLTPIFNPANTLCCITSFGEDADGELFVVTRTKVYRIFDDGRAYMDLEKVGDFEEPLYATSPPGDASRLVVMQKNGIVQLIKDGVRRETPFLDITDRVATDGELGLLGIAFHPQFATNGYIYTNYLRRTGEANETMQLRISRFTAAGDPATAETVDPDSELNLITIDKPKDDHSGGWLGFSPVDGYLYIPLGDGGCCNNVYGHAQNLATLYGKILRIDVDNADPGLNYAIPPDNPFRILPGARHEIWALGLRNPFRASFDRDTGDFYFGDVGQEHIEEISFQPFDSAGAENYGWPIFEGTRCNVEVTTVPECDAYGPTMVAPIHEYDREFGGSAIGGAVYRGTAIPGLQSRYIFADFFSSRVFSFLPENGIATGLREDSEDLDAKRRFIEAPVAISEDGVGELYLCNYTGAVYKIVQGLGNDAEDRDDEEGEGEGEDPVAPLGVSLVLGASRDATLYEDALGQTASGSAMYIFAGRTGDNAEYAVRRALIDFDLSALPPDAEILSATLRLRCSKLPVGGENTEISLHRVTRPWSEGPSDPGGAGGMGTQAQTGDVTWLHTTYDTAFWNTPGGDFDPIASASVPVNTIGVHTWSSPGLLNDIRAWRANPASNRGWVLLGNESLPKTARRFDSHEHSNANNRPQLIIRYCGSPQEGWVFNPANGHYYRLTEEVDFATALAQAQCVGGYLATINTSAENQFILENLLNAGAPAWIGYNDIAQEGVFAWSNGEVAVYQNWAANEPSGGDTEDAVLMSHVDGTWSDVPVSNIAIAIVERNDSPYFTEGEGEEVEDGEGDRDGDGTSEGEGAADGEGMAEGEGVGARDGEGIDEGEGEGADTASAVQQLLAGFSTGDTDNDGLLEFVEAQGLWPRLSEVQFATLDSNGDARLSVAELIEVAEDAPVHRADHSGDRRIQLAELLRVVQLYNSGGYHCAQSPGATEDGYLPGTGLAQDCAPHSSDYAPSDWVLSLSEMLRLVQLFNVGGYSIQCGTTEDGFCPVL